MFSYFLFPKVAYSNVQTHLHLNMTYMKNYHTWAPGCCRVLLVALSVQAVRYSETEGG